MTQYYHYRKGKEGSVSVSVSASVTRQSLNSIILKLTTVLNNDYNTLTDTIIRACGPCSREGAVHCGGRGRTDRSIRRRIWSHRGSA